uniref:GIY-YIG domain-containing protein n=1 Tax=Morchella importuna TaxID=1174673 RepID=A0A650AG51_9PEZI|nr:hypothetical protein [Morchella importuna]QGN66639.1 hypothetical protein [Morchella importuna]
MINNLKPVATYENPDVQQDQIYFENKGKAGIYRWTNKLNGKIYIGSSVDLSTRFRFYYSEQSMENNIKNNKSAIYSSILKNGILNFKLEILVYCEPEECIELEQDWIDLLKADYNILRIAGSCLGGHTGGGN